MFRRYIFFALHFFLFFNLVFYDLEAFDSHIKEAGNFELKSKRLTSSKNQLNLMQLFDAGEDDGGYYGGINEDINPIENRAYGPTCYITPTDIGIMLTVPLAAFVTFNIGRKLYRSPSAGAKAAGAAAMIGAAASTLAFLMSSVPAACLFSFVRNPVAFYSMNVSPSHPDYAHRGQMKKRISNPGSLISKFEPTENVWEAENAPYSDKLMVCVRTPNLINLGFGVGCRGQHIGGTELDLFKGKDTRMCPEEWQNLGIAGFYEDGEWRVRSDTVKDYKIENYSLYNKDLLNYKRTAGPVYCSNFLKNGDSVSLGMYSYIVHDTGSRICAYLVGVGAVPYIRNINVGCHWSDSKNAAYPMCTRAKPIREDGQWDDDIGGIVPDTGQGKIIDYDNSECYGCVASSACVGKDLRPHKAFIPMTSVVYRCIKESVSRFIYGCVDEGDGTVYEKSYVAVIQDRLRDAIRITIALGISFFAMGILLGGHSRLQKKDIMLLIIKLSCVVFFTYSDPNGFGGMQTFAYGFELLSSNLTGIVTEASLSANKLCTFDSSEYLIPNDSDSKRSRFFAKKTGEEDSVKDYRYLRPWDMLDCRIMFYLGAPLISVMGLGDGIQDGDHIGVALVLNVLTLFLAIILAGPFFPLLAVMVLGFFIMMMVLMLWVFELIILSMIAYYVIVLVSPIFIPMVLFNHTKAIFDGWLKQGMAFLIFPVVLVSYLGFVMASFDSLMFGDTEFERKEVFIFGSKSIYFFVKSNNSCESGESLERGKMPCGCDKDSLGCFFSDIKFVTKKIFFDIKATGMEIPESRDIGEVCIKLFTLILMAFLYTHFTNVILGIASELSGGSKALNSMGQMTTSAKSRGERAFSKLMSPTSSLGDLQRKTKKGKEDEGQDENSSVSRGSATSGSDIISDAKNNNPNEGKGNDSGGASNPTSPKKEES